MIDILARALTARLNLRLRHQLRFHRIYEELAYSSDRALAELGLSRGDVGTVASGRYGRP